MIYKRCNRTNATASGALADAPASADNRGQGAAEKYTTGQLIMDERPDLQPHQLERTKCVTPKRCLKLAAWNVRTGFHVGQRETIARELLRYGIAITALSELRLTGSGNMRIDAPDNDDWLTLYYSGGEQHTEGVGFAVDSKSSSSVIAFQPISSRIATLSVLGTVRMHIISVYAPTEVSTDEAKDAFYAQLQETVDALPTGDLILIAGDFNAHVGSAQSGWQNIMGKFGVGETNDNGFRLRSFAAANELMIGNSLFRHPLKHQLSWRAPNGKDISLLDYVLVNARFRTSLRDVRVMRGADCGTDHHLVRALVQLRLKRQRKPANVVRQREWSKLAEPACKQQFQISLSNRFAALAELNIDVKEKAERFAVIVSECAKEICPPPRKRTQAWISDECLDLIDQRKRCKLTDKAKYQQLHGTVRRRLKAERAAYWDNVAAEMEEAAHRCEFSHLYKTLRRLSGKTRNTNDNIKKTDGTFVRSTDERLKRWQEYFQQLYNFPPPSTPLPTPPDSNAPHEPIPDNEPTTAEIRHAIKQLKTRKAAGEDEVTAEALKAGGEILVKQLHSILQLIWHTEEIPRQWKRGIIIPVFKKGDSQDCKNYRGISLLSIVGKVFIGIIQRRLQKRRELTAREEQAGFRPGRGCCDQVFTLRQVLEERIRCGKRTVIIFVDFKAAFDSVYRPALWAALTAEHVPPKITSLLQRTYEGSSSYVRIKGDLSKEFTVATGVRQGCIASPLLFNTVVDAIMRRVFEDRRGVEVGEGQVLTDLMYADDSAVLANDDDEATAIINDIQNAARPYGLIINAEKTEVLTSDGSPASVRLGDVELKQVSQFKYLGSIVQGKKVAATADVANRIGQAAAAFGALAWCVWKKNNISTTTKMRLFRSLVLPILLYGAETWTLLKADLTKLEVFQMRCLRRILGVTLRDRLSNETIRTRCCNQPTVEDEIQRRRLRWFGHVCRMNPDRLPHRILWRTRPPGWKVTRSAPKKTWAMQIKDDLTNQRLDLQAAKMVAQDRQRWRNIVRNVREHSAPTTAYWLRGQPRPDDR